MLAALEVKPATAHTLTGSNFDSRVLVAMRLDADAVQAAMPEGWTLFPFPGGALEGANSLLIFADRNLGMDAEGMPNDPASYRAMAMASLGKSTTTDEVRTFVTRVYTTVGGNDPYGNARPASISRRAAVESMDGEQPKFTEEWSLLSDGGKMSLSLSNTAGPLSWATRESQSYSNVDPSIHHLNRFEQLSDLAMSAPLGKALDGELEINSSIPELAALFDGKESTIAVIVIPMYVREVFEPEGLTCLISPASFAGEITFGSGLGNRLSLRNIASGTSTASPSPLRDQRRCSLDKQHDVTNLFPTLGELYSIPTLRTKRLLLRSSERSVLFRSLPRFIPTFKLGF